MNGFQLGEPNVGDSNSDSRGGVSKSARYPDSIPAKTFSFRCLFVVASTCPRWVHTEYTTREKGKKEE